MKLTYRARRRLKNLGIVLLCLLVVLSLVWFCWVTWAERYVLYTDEGAKLDFSLRDPEGGGQLAVPPSAEETINLHINEGSDAVDLNNALTQITGFYIDADSLTGDLAGLKDTIAKLPKGSAVMMDVKDIRGNFFYSSGLEDAVVSTQVDTAAVDSLIEELNQRSIYTIARFSSLADRNFGLNHTNSGLPQKGKHYLMVHENAYWLKPTDATTMNWISQIIGELKDRGFDEVVLDNFHFPATNTYDYSGDQAADLASSAKTLVSTWATGTFAVSFVTDTTDFQLPEGRSRMYLENVGAKDVAATAARVTVPDPKVNLVFLSTTNDTRFNDFSVLRPIAAAALDAE